MESRLPKKITEDLMQITESTIITKNVHPYWIGRPSRLDSQNPLNIHERTGRCLYYNSPPGCCIILPLFPSRVFDGAKLKVFPRQRNMKRIQLCRQSINDISPCSNTCLAFSGPHCLKQWRQMRTAIVLLVMKKRWRLLDSSKRLQTASFL